MDIKKQKQVYEILYMPIEVISSSGFGDDRKVSIKKEGNVIKTTQTYWPEYRDKVSHKLFRYDFNPDCDMSDFACGFYEIIYKSILAGDVLVNNNNGCMVNKQYAGDTMTSVSLLPGLYEKYHCLANFWIIPMELGRRSNHILSKTSKRYNVQDFMDRFLLLMKYRFDFYKNEFPDYFKQINSFEQMSDIHFLRGSYLDGYYNIRNYSNEIDVNTENYLWTCILKRAELISKSELGQLLWEYFNEIGIL